MPHENDMPEEDDSHFFNFSEFEEAQKDPMQEAAMEALKEAHLEALRKHITRKYKLAEDEIETLIGNTIEALSEFVKDREKIAKEGRKNARTFNEDEEFLDDDGDEDEAETAEIDLSPEDKAHAKLRLTEVDKLETRSRLSKAKQRDKAFKGVASKDKPSTDEFSELLDLMSCADRDPEEFDEDENEKGKK